MEKEIATNRTILARRYGVCYNTFLKMLKEIGFEMKQNRRVLTVKELNFILDELGEPPPLPTNKNKNKQSLTINSSQSM